jgi:hypothetical protein
MVERNNEAIGHTRGRRDLLFAVDGLRFSPVAAFMATGSRSVIASMLRPQVLSAANWPPMTFALPGPVTTVVTPASRAS